MRPNKVRFIALIISAVLLLATAWPAIKLPVDFRFLTGALFFACAIIYFQAEWRIHHEFRDKIARLQGRLNQSFNEILEEAAVDVGLEETLSVLEENSPDRGPGKDIIERMENTQSLFNKEINLFRRKNRIIQDLNEKILFSKQQLEAVFDAQDDALCIVDQELKIFRLNKAYARYCGQDLRSLLGQKSHQVFPGLENINPDTLVARTFASSEMITGIPFETQALQDRSYFLFNSYPIQSDGKPLYVLEHFRNITAEKKINEQLIRSANLASIGTMIAGIAHEMNNPLSGIAGCAHNMLTSPDTFGINAKGRERIKDILDSAERAETILKGLLDLSRKRENQFIIMNISPIIERALQSIHLEGYGKVRKTLTTESGLRPVINCDPARVTQIFINLFSNATFSVLDRAKEESAAGRDYRPEIRIHLLKRENFLHISILDNGLGIPSEKVTQIFDPFFTTRSPGQGTGLGLSICHKIMLEHNGRISIETHSRGNTCFAVEFPLTGAA